MNHNSTSQTSRRLADPGWIADDQRGPGLASLPQRADGHAMAFAADSSHSLVDADDCLEMLSLLH